MVSRNRWGCFEKAWCFPMVSKPHSAQSQQRTRVITSKNVTVDLPDQQIPATVVHRDGLCTYRSKTSVYKPNSLGAVRSTVERVLPRWVAQPEQAVLRCNEKPRCRCRVVIGRVVIARRIPEHSLHVGFLCLRHTPTAWKCLPANGNMERRHATICITIPSEFAALCAGAFCGNAVRSYAKNYERAASVLRCVPEQSLNRESTAFAWKADASRGYPAVER